MQPIYTKDESITSVCGNSGGANHVISYCKNCQCSLNAENVCTKHPDKMKNFHCKDCRQDVCSKCVEEEHLGHNLKMDYVSKLQQQSTIQKKENSENARQHQTLNIGFPTASSHELMRHTEVPYRPFIVQQDVKPFNADCAWLLGFLTCFCCVWPVGLIAIFMAYKAQNTAEEHGDVITARKWKIASYSLSLASFLLGIVVLIVILTVTLNEAREY